MKTATAALLLLIVATLAGCGDPNYQVQEPEHHKVLIHPVPTDEK